MQEEPPPQLAHKAANPRGDVSADRLVAPARRTLAPDNAHHIPLSIPRGLARQMPVSRRGRPPRDRTCGHPGNPPEPGYPRRYLAGWPGNNQATVRSALLTLAV